jgi:hypothetical protein
VLEEFIVPDLDRLYDEARVDFVLAHLRGHAADLLGEEIVEVGRFAGRTVRAVARTASGGAVAALVLQEPSTAALEREMAELSAALGPRIEKLVYGLTSKPERPLEVDVVPAGELV